jgi:hypothetical protein
MIVAEDVSQFEKVVGAVSRNCVVGEVHILESSSKNFKEVNPVLRDGQCVRHACEK